MLDITSNNQGHDMDNRERQAAFKASMRSKGFVAATEWVPSEHRELFRSVARALRDGLSVTIGAAAASVSTHEPVEAPIRDSDRPDEYFAEKAEKRKQDEKARQARYAEQWNAATETVRVFEDGSRRKVWEGRIIKRKKGIVPRLDGRRLSVEWFTGIVLEGSKYRPLAFSIWEGEGVQFTKPGKHWMLEPAELIKAAKRRVQDLHPDKGGPGGDEFNAALAELNALRGRF